MAGTVSGLSSKRPDFQKRCQGMSRPMRRKSLSAQKPWHVSSPSRADSVLSKTLMMSKPICILREIGAPTTGAGLSLGSQRFKDLKTKNTSSALPEVSSTPHLERGQELQQEVLLLLLLLLLSLLIRHCSACVMAC